MGTNPYIPTQGGWSFLCSPNGSGALQTILKSLRALRQLGLWAFAIDTEAQPVCSVERPSQRPSPPQLTWTPGFPQTSHWRLNTHLMGTLLNLLPTTTPLPPPPCVLLFVR